MSKASKRRDCPAARRILSAVECGAGRNRVFACPAECSFNPFSPARYESLADCEREATGLAIQHLALEDPDALGLASGFEEAVRSGDEFGAEVAVAGVFFRKRDFRGTTFLERWLAAGAKELGNDARLVLERRAQSRIMLLEVLRVVDAQTFEAIDHLAPGAPRLRLIDRSLAAIVCRFETLLVFGYPLPHYWRVLGGAVQVPDLDSLDVLGLARAIAAHLGGPAVPEEIETWLWANLDRFRRSLDATFIARQRRLLESTDAHWASVEYTLESTAAEARACLSPVTAVEPDSPTEQEAREGFSEALAWFEHEESPGARDRLARSVLGRILIGPATWRLQGSGEQRIERLRARFEDLLGDRVRFCRRTVDDLRPRIQVSPMPDGAEDLVVPALVGEGGPMIVGSQRVRAIPGVSPSELMARVAEEANRDFLDAPIPLLRGSTPRAAALDPTLRGTLIQMVKNRVRQVDEANLRSGRADSIDWMIRELGLTEILQDPPPPRAIPQPRSSRSLGGRPAPGHDEEYDEEYDEGPSTSPVPWLHRPPAPLLPAAPLTLEEAAARMEEIQSEPLGPKEVLAELDASGSSLFEDLRELIGDRMNAGESAVLTACAMQIWFVLVPPGCRAPEYDLGRWEELRNQTEERLADSMNSLDSDSDPLAALDASAQPGMARLAAITYLRMREAGGKRAKISPEAEFESVAVLVSLVDLLDEALGRGPGG